MGIVIVSLTTMMIIVIAIIVISCVTSMLIIIFAPVPGSLVFQPLCIQHVAATPCMRLPSRGQEFEGGDSQKH
jgi:hypothetical protein